MKIRINKKHLQQGCVFTFNHTCFNGKKESIILKPFLSELDNTIMYYTLHFKTESGNYFRFFNDYIAARKSLTEQTKNW